MDNSLEQDITALWSLLLEIVSDSEKRLAAHLATHNLTPPQFFVLKTLDEHGGRCPIGQIAREHHLTNPTMTGLIKRLTLMEPPLVERERSKTDRRSVDIVLTPTGAKRYEAVQTDLLKQVRLVLGMLNPEDRRDIIEKASFYINLIIRQFPASNV